MLTHQLEAEINGISTEVEVDFEMQFGQPEIVCIMAGGELVESNEIDNLPLFKAELTEWAANVGQMRMDYLIANS